MCGVVKSCVEMRRVVYGDMWSCMKMCEDAWSCEELCGHAWRCKELQGVVKSCMEMCEDVWKCRVMRSFKICVEMWRVVWRYVELHGNVWRCVKMHRVVGGVKGCMEMHGVVWKCMGMQSCEEFWGYVNSCVELCGVAWKCAQLRLWEAHTTWIEDWSDHSCTHYTTQHWRGAHTTKHSVKRRSRPSEKICFRFKWLSVNRQSEFI